MPGSEDACKMKNRTPGTTRIQAFAMQLGWVSFLDFLAKTKAATVNPMADFDNVCPFGPPNTSLRPSA
jgi:hypothetical protein